MSPRKAGFGLPLRMAPDRSKFLDSVSKLARTAITAVADLAPVLAQLGFVAIICVLVGVTRRKGVFANGSLVFDYLLALNDLGARLAEVGPLEGVPIVRVA